MDLSLSGSNLNAAQKGISDNSKICRGPALHVSYPSVGVTLSFPVSFASPHRVVRLLFWSHSLHTSESFLQAIYCGGNLSRITRQSPGASSAQEQHSIDHSSGKLRNSNDEARFPLVVTASMGHCGQKQCLSLTTIYSNIQRINRPLITAVDHDSIRWLTT